MKSTTLWHLSSFLFSFFSYFCVWCSWRPISKSSLLSSIAFHFFNVRNRLQLLDLERETIRVILQSLLGCSQSFWLPKCLLTISELSSAAWAVCRWNCKNKELIKFVVKCSNRPHNCKTNHFTSWMGWLQLGKYKNEKRKAKAWETTVFRCSIFRIWTFLPPCSPIAHRTRGGGTRKCQGRTHFQMITPIKQPAAYCKEQKPRQRSINNLYNGVLNFRNF